MIVYLQENSRFLEDVLAGSIEETIHDKVRQRIGIRAGASKRKSWHNSLETIHMVMVDDEIPDDAGVAIEFRIPRTAKRIDSVEIEDRNGTILQNSNSALPVTTSGAARANLAAVSVKKQTWPRIGAHISYRFPHLPVRVKKPDCTPQARVSLAHSANVPIPTLSILDHPVFCLLLTITTKCRNMPTSCRTERPSARKVAVSQPLANAELAVMNLLWQNDTLTARQLREQLYPDATKAQHGTVQRLLQRLEDKGYVERDRSLSIHFFSAAVSLQVYAGGQLESLAKKLTAGSLAPLITHLVERKEISRSEIDQIRAILDEHEVKKGGPKGNRKRKGGKA